MEIAEAVAAEQLWGWPVSLLDELLFLQRKAWSGQLPLASWRAEDASLREGQPEVDAAEVEAALNDWVSSGQLQLGPHGVLLGRLTVLANRPPSDDDLWVELIAVAKRAFAEDANPRFAEVDKARGALIVSWLARDGSDIDAESGLPASLVAKHDSAEAALDALPDLERQCAGLIVAGRA
jgi:hypothetical protein